MLNYLLIVLGALLVLLIILFEIKKYKIHLLSKDIPYLSVKSLLGLTQKLSGMNIEQLADYTMTLMPDTCDIFTIKSWFGPWFGILTIDPEVVQTILTSPKFSHRPFQYKFMKGAEGFLATEHEDNKKNRRLILPSFNAKVLKAYNPIIDKKITQLIQVLGRVADTGRTIDMHDKMVKFAFDLSTNTLASTTIDLQETEEVQTLVTALSETMDIIAKRMFSPWFYSDFLYKLSSKWKIQEKYLETLINFMEKFRINKLKELEEAKRTGSPPFIRRNGKLEWEESQLTPLVLCCKLHMEGVIDENRSKLMYYSGLGGGFDTTALTIGNTVLFLAMNPHIQEHLYNELVAAYGSDPDIDIDLAIEVSYVEMVLKETLRLLPVFPFIARQTKVDAKLNETTTIPAGTIAVLFMYSMHRHKAIWGPDADQFNPERFNEENAKKRHPYAFIPFSNGPKVCIGIKYAWIVLKKVLSKLVLNYKFSTDLKLEELRFIYHISLTVINRDRIVVEKRIRQ